MKASEMTDRMLLACSLRCTLRLPKKDGAVALDSGEWWCYRAKSEPARRYRKAAIEDLRKRELGQKIQTLEFSGKFGRVKIGGKMFSYFPASQMLVRDDFADWCERHIDECWDFHLHRERLPESDTSGKAVKTDTLPKDFSEVRRLAMKMGEVTDLLEPGTWNSLYEMRSHLAQYGLAVNAMKANGRFYAGTCILADQLAATLAYREKRYADSQRLFLRMAAVALRASQYVQEVAEREKRNRPGGAVCGTGSEVAK